MEVIFLKRGQEAGSGIFGSTQIDRNEPLSVQARANGRWSFVLCDVLVELSAMDSKTLSLAFRSYKSACAEG
jgi:hypothetical protein